MPCIACPFSVLVPLPYTKNTPLTGIYAKLTPELIPLQGSAFPEVPALLKLTSPWLAHMDEETRFTCGLYYVSKERKEETDAAIKAEFLNLVEKLYGSGGLSTYEFARSNDMSRLGFNTSVLQAEIAANATGAIPMSVLQSMVFISELIIITLKVTII